VVNLEYERGKMTALCDQEAQQISRLKEVLDIVKQYVLTICASLAAFVMESKSDSLLLMSKVHKYYKY